PRFDLAALVLRACLDSVFVIEVHDNAGDFIIETVELVGDAGAYPLYEPGTSFNVVIAVDLNLHKRLSFCIFLGHTALLKRQKGLLMFRREPRTKRQQTLDSH